MKYLKDVATLKLDQAKCTGCTMCTKVCPHDVFVMEEKRARIVDKDRCMECGACQMNCPSGAITVDAGVGCASAIISGFFSGGEACCGPKDDGSEGGCC